MMLTTRKISLFIIIFIIYYTENNFNHFTLFCNLYTCGTRYFKLFLIENISINTIINKYVKQLNEDKKLVTWK
jgi:hypothetical protein